MRAFYLFFENWQTVSANLSWSHYIELISLEDRLIKINCFRFGNSSNRMRRRLTVCAKFAHSGMDSNRCKIRNS